MAMETPIVATDAGGTRELAAHERDALIVPVHDAGALADAIGRVVDDSAGARARVAAARRRVETDLSFDGRTRSLERIYDELMAGLPQAAAAGGETGIRHA
jgi:glycosyltransferase involved in cell wall biosynthesis